MNASNSSRRAAKTALVLALAASASVPGFAAALYVRVWNFTGMYFSQWGNNNYPNVICISGPDFGCYINGPHDGAFAQFGPYTTAGTYTVQYNCVYGDQTTDNIGVGYYDGISTVTWDWAVYPHNCSFSSVPSQIRDGSDRGPRRDPCDEPAAKPRAMPQWGVSEPYLNLWLEDEPLGYQPAAGDEVTIHLAYKQRESSSGFDPATFSVGKKWNCSWLSCVTRDAQGHSVLSFPGGGSTTFYGTNDFLTQTRLLGDTSAGFELVYPTGATNVYGFIVTNSGGSFLKAFLSEARNPSGQPTRFHYDGYSPAAPAVRLRYVVDGDGQTNTIFYETNNAFSTNLISTVVDPFGRSASLQYDSNGRLVSVTDAAGLSSSFAYDGNQWVTNLTTPYGDTTFSFTDPTPGSADGRSVLVTEPDGSHELFYYKDLAPGIPSYCPVAQFPGAAPVFVANFPNSTLENYRLDTRNTFHWGRLQYGSLAQTNIANFSTNEFRAARMNHWLLSSQDSTVSEVLSLSREPSPAPANGIDGQVTWYGYTNRSPLLTHLTGSQSLPLFLAKMLPDGSTHFTRTERNDLGLPIRTIETYSIPSGIGLRTNTFAYAANGIDLVNATNALGVRVLTNRFNAYHQVATNWNALGETTVFTYNDKHQLTSAARPSGLITTNFYFTSGPASNFLDRAIDYAVVAGSTVNYRTNAFTWTSALVFTHTDPRGLTVTNTWDNLNRLRRADYPDATFVTNTFDKLDLVRVIDRMGFTNSFGYNAVRQRIAATNANGVVSRYTYCSCGSLESVTNAFGTAVQQATWYYHDNQGNLTQTVGPDAYTVTRNFNALGQVTNSFDGQTSVTNWFNNQGLQTASSNAAGQISAAIFDALDRATNSTDANAVTVTNTFDALDRLLSRGYPDGGVERFGYTLNVAGLTSATNQLGSNILNVVYDPLGRKTAEIVPDVTTNSFTYSGASDLLTLTDGKGHVTTWNFDAYGRATNKLDANNAEMFRWAYDPNGRLTNRWTPEKGTTRFTVDAVGNRTLVDYPSSPDITLQYDPLDRLTNMVDAVGTTRYTFGAAGLLASEDGPWADDTVSYSYQYRLRTGLSLAQPGGSAWSQSYAYDAARRLQTLTSPAGTFGYGFDPVRHALVNKISLPNSAYITNTFDLVARLTGTFLKNNSGTVLNSHQYISNLAGQRTRQTRTQGDSVDYGYDNGSQLLSALGQESSGTNRLNERLRYVYDAAGNLNWRTNNALAQEFQVNNLNELTTIGRSGTLTVAGTTTGPATNVTVNALEADRYADATFARAGFSPTNGDNSYTAVARDSYGRVDTNTIIASLPATRTFAYGANGSLTNDGRLAYGYDDENQLSSISATGAWKSEFVYDGQQRRRVERDYGWNGASWVLTNEVRLVCDGTVILQQRGSDNLPTLTFTRGLDLSGTFQGGGGIGGLLAMTESSLFALGPSRATHSYYHSDGSGNITCLINTNQFSVARATYDPFGTFISISGPAASVNLFWYSSKPLHRLTGNHDFLYRWYSPELQRWLNRDPIGEYGGLNLYRFVRNSPLRYVDPYGLAYGDWWDVRSYFNDGWIRYAYTGDPNASDEVFDAATDDAGAYIRCNSPLRGAYGFAGVQTPRGKTLIPGSHVHGEVLGLGGWDVSDGGWGGVIAAGGVGPFSGGYEYIFADHGSFINLVDSSKLPIGGFITEGKDGLQIGLYIHKSFAKDYGSVGGGFYWDVNKLGSYVKGDYWKGRMPCECE